MHVGGALLPDALAKGAPVHGRYARIRVRPAHAPVPLRDFEDGDAGAVAPVARAVRDTPHARGVMSLNFYDAACHAPLPPRVPSPSAREARAFQSVGAARAALRAAPWSLCAVPPVRRALLPACLRAMSGAMA